MPGRIHRPEMLRLRRDGLSLTAIGARFGVSRQAVSQSLQRAARPSVEDVVRAVGTPGAGFMQKTDRSALYLWCVDAGWIRQRGRTPGTLAWFVKNGDRAVAVEGERVVRLVRVTG